MADIINVNSPMGYTVVCSEKQWNLHILTGHGEMEGNEKAVENTVRDPELVRRDNDYDNRQVYFSKSAGADYEKNGFGTKVIVEVSNPSIPVGDVITACASRRIGGNGDDDQLLYKRPSKD